jgi:hypothetical protein
MEASALLWGDSPTVNESFEIKSDDEDVGGQD